MHGVHGGGSAGGGEEAVGGRWRSASLGVPEDRQARVVAGALGELGGDRRSRGALVGPFGIQQHGPFGHDNDRGRRSRVMTALDLLRQVGEIGRVLGEAERVRTRSNPGAHGQPPRGSAHDLHDHEPVMALTGRLNPVDGLRRGRHCSVETDTALRPRHVVVDRLGDADDRYADLGEIARRAEGPVPADDDERVEPFPLEGRDDRCDATFVLIGVKARRAQDGAAALQQALGLGHRERRGVAFDHTTPAVVKPDDLVSEGGSGPHDGADGGVQPRAVTAARQQADPHGASSWLRVSKRV